MKNKWVWITILLLLILVFAWSPWITKDFAEKMVIDDFNKKWCQVVDGCGFNCENCGVYESNKALFGYEVIILYSCGFKEYPTEIPDWQDKIFVSPFGTVHTLSHQTNLD